VTPLQLQQLTPELLRAVLDLDQQCFGGLWTQEGYQRELDSPNSDLLILLPVPKETGETGEPIQNPKSKIQNPNFPTQNSKLKTQNSPLLALGCLWAILDEAHITIVAVHPDYQRQGLGQAMLYALLHRAYDRGLERATLEVRISNQSAVELYQKFDFREAGRRRRYYADTGEDAIVMWRGGLQTPDFQNLLTNWKQKIGDRLQQSGWNLNVASDTVAKQKSFLTCA
jgi:[ribosomal protein S18]-alanine N-acetyltransferase